MMSYSDEMNRVLARPDAEKLIRQVEQYANWNIEVGVGEWPEADSDDFSEILMALFHDPSGDTTLAYVVIAVDRVDDADFLRLMGCSLLEEVLYRPTDQMLERIEAEARKSARFRWLLSCPFKRAVSEQAWNAIAKFRITGPHEEPGLDTFPKR